MWGHQLSCSFIYLKISYAQFCLLLFECMLKWLFPLSVQDVARAHNFFRLAFETLVGGFKSPPRTFWNLEPSRSSSFYSFLKQNNFQIDIKKFMKYTVALKMQMSLGESIKLHLDCDWLISIRNLSNFYEASCFQLKQTIKMCSF